MPCSSNGGPGSTTTGGPVASSGGGTISPGAVPTGSSTVAPAGTSACLRVAAAVASGSVRQPRPARQPGDDVGDALFQRGVERRRPALEVGDDLGGQVVGGRTEAARGDDQVHARLGEEAQGRAQVVGTVADDDHVRDVDAGEAQLLGQPGPVAIADAAGEDLGAGDDDPRSTGHALDPRSGRISRMAIWADSGLAV